MDEAASRKHGLSRSAGSAPKACAPAAVRPLMEISFDKEALRGLIAEVLTVVIGAIDWPTGRVALDEAEAARACGVGRHVLRDLRLSRQIQARKLGRKVVYTREDLMRAIDSLRS